VTARPACDQPVQASQVDSGSGCSQPSACAEAPRQEFSFSIPEEEDLIGTLGSFRISIMNTDLLKKPGFEGRDRERRPRSGEMVIERDCARGPSWE
jgi:hypothetical protein